MSSTPENTPDPRPGAVPPPPPPPGDARQATAGAPPAGAQPAGPQADAGRPSAGPHLGAPPPSPYPAWSQGTAGRTGPEPGHGGPSGGYPAGGYPPAPPPGYGGPSGAPAGAPPYGGGQPLTPADQRLWAVLSHLGTLLVWVFAPLVIWLAFRGRGAFLEDHAKESLNFQITVAITAAVLGFLSIVTFGLGALLYVPYGVLVLVFLIIAAVKASQGETYRYPLTLRLVK